MVLPPTLVFRMFEGAKLLTKLQAYFVIFNLFCNLLVLLFIYVGYPIGFRHDQAFDPNSQHQRLAS